MATTTPLFRFKRGDHICIFYHDGRELLEMLVPYIVAGLQGNERCFCVQTPTRARELKTALNQAGIDVRREKKRGALEVHSEREVYFPNGQFEPETMIGMLESSIGDAARQGFSGFRTAGELHWAARGKRSCDQIIEYERMVDELFPQRAATGLCQYPVAAFDAATLKAVLEAHRMALTETMARANHSSLYVRQGSYAADIVADRLNPSSRYYYVVQPHGKREIVGFGVEESFDEAMRASQHLTAAMNARHGAGSQAGSAV